VPQAPAPAPVEPPGARRIQLLKTAPRNPLRRVPPAPRPVQRAKQRPSSAWSYVPPTRWCHKALEGRARTRPAHPRKVALTVGRLRSPLRQPSTGLNLTNTRASEKYQSRPRPPSWRRRALQKQPSGAAEAASVTSAHPSRVHGHIRVVSATGLPPAASAELRSRTAAPPRTTPSRRCARPWRRWRGQLQARGPSAMPGRDQDTALPPNRHRG